MVRHALLYLLDKDETQPRLEDWPEISRVEFLESADQYLQNFCMGGPFDISAKVISIRVGDDYGLKYIRECVRGTHVIALRTGKAEAGEWLSSLLRMTDDRAIVVCDFDRHSVLSALGRKAYWDGIELLQVAVGYLRGPGVHASPEAMQTEKALTKAIDTLCSNGYKTPK